MWLYLGQVWERMFWHPEDPQSCPGGPGGTGSLIRFHLWIFQKLVKCRPLPAPHPRGSNRAALGWGQETSFNALPLLSAVVGGVERVGDHT